MTGKIVEVRVYRTLNGDSRIDLSIAPVETNKQLTGYSPMPGQMIEISLAGGQDG